MPRASLKTVTDADPVAEFEAARAAFQEVQDTHYAMCDRLEAIKLAQNYAVAASLANVPPNLLEKAKPFMRLAKRRPDKLAGDLADLQDQIEEHQPFYVRANEIWQAAMQAETDRIAIEIQPRHRDAVRAIATALEDLSRAVAAERELHDELKGRAPLPASAFMPRLAEEFGDVCLSVWGSRAWYWARRVNKLKIL